MRSNPGRVKRAHIVSSSPGRVKRAHIVGSSPGRVKRAHIVGSSPGRLKRAHIVVRVLVESNQKLLKCYLLLLLLAPVSRNKSKDWLVLSQNNVFETLAI